MNLLVACSGPGAATAIRASIVTGYVCAAVSAVVVAALAFDHWRQRRLGLRLMLAVTLLAFHPAWTISAFRGDCGTEKRDLSYASVVVLFGLLLWQLGSGRSTAVPPNRYTFSLRDLFIVLTVISTALAFLDGSVVALCAIVALPTVALMLGHLLQSHRRPRGH